VERRFRDMGRIIKIFRTTQGDWDEILPIFLLTTRNKVNKTTGFSPAMMLFGEELRLPNAIDAKVEVLQDQATELKKLVIRKALVDKVVHDKKRKLYEESQKAAEERLETIGWRVGQRAFYYVDKRTLGQNKKTTISWSGPFEVAEVRENTLVLLRNGKKAVVNQTKCVALKELSIPERDMRGRVLDKEAADKDQQDKIMKEKVQRLAQKLKAGKHKGSVSDSEEESEDDFFDDESPEEHKLRQLAKSRPKRKASYNLPDLKDGCIAVIWAFEATRLGKFLFARFVPGDREAWIRFHLFGSEHKLSVQDRVFYPTWKSGKKDVLAPDKRQGFSPFWVDIYLKDILYILRFPLQGGKIDKRDAKEMGYGTEAMVLPVEVRSG